MSKFNRGALATPAALSPVTSELMPSGHTFEGGAGYARDARSELFLLAVTNLVGENTFYEAAGERDSRYTQLVRTAARSDPEWTARFLRWLRTEANLRSAALVGAAEFVRARLAGPADPVPGVTNRAVVDSVLRRADEPGEFLAYWTSHYGRRLPMPVKRGVADAAQRLYDERALLKYDTDSHAYRFADVLELTHAAPRADWQGALFRHAIDRRHQRGQDIPAALPTLARRAELLAWPVERRQALFGERGEAAGEDAAAVLRAAGMTWEAVAGWSQGPMTGAVWQALIPSMGYMALLRNLRNFDQAGVSDEVAARVAARLADPAQVARSRQLPMRFLSAYRAAPSLRWAWALEQAITLSLGNVPELPGRTLVLVDTSGSMGAPFSRDGTLMRWDAAAVFGLALAGRCAQADVVSFSAGPGWLGSRVFRPARKESLLRAVERWRSAGYLLGRGTDTEQALRRHFTRHDRVVILTDEQAARGDVGQALPPRVPLYTWNLAGYQHGHAVSGVADRHVFGGLTDQAFRMIPLLEAGRDADWPF